MLRPATYARSSRLIVALLQWIRMRWDAASALTGATVGAGCVTAALLALRHNCTCYGSAESLVLV